MPTNFKSLKRFERKGNKAFIVYKSDIALWTFIISILLIIMFQFGMKYQLKKEIKEYTELSDKYNKLYERYIDHEEYCNKYHYVLYHYGVDGYEEEPKN